MAYASVVVVFHVCSSCSAGMMGWSNDQFCSTLQRVCDWKAWFVSVSVFACCCLISAEPLQWSAEKFATAWDGVRRNPKQPEEAAKRRYKNKSTKLWLCCSPALNARWIVRSFYLLSLINKQYLRRFFGCPHRLINIYIRYYYFHFVRRLLPRNRQ